MPKKAREMGAAEVSKLTAPGLHFVGGVAGLALQVSPTGATSWVLRAVVGGKRRDMGLGGYPDVLLADARRAAREAREAIKKGEDPIEKNRAARSELAAARAALLTFKECAERYIKTHSASWRNAKHAAQWGATLETYAYPVIGSLLARDVTLAHVLQVLEPLWETKTETASRLRGRIEKVLDWAKGRGYRSGDNPAAWKGNLQAHLADPTKIAKTEHHRAVPVADIGAFMVRLRAQEGMGARALEFAILTAARSGEVRGAKWAEIDRDAKTWTVPGDRMKAGREHRVPLSEAALALLDALPENGDELIFPAPRGGVLSDMTLTAVMRRMEVDAVPHGFRSTFRDWAGERTNYPRDMAEMALAHAIDSKTEAAYRRGDMLAKRFRMMEDWAEFVAKPAPKANVVPMRKAKA